MLGQTISHYLILEKLGQGGMGVVYKAQDTKLNRSVALKFLPPDLTREQEAIGRFINEAQTASSLDHPNICTIHEISETEDGQMYIVMAYYAGETLEKKITSTQLSVDSAIDIAMQTAQGLLRAHEAGITHRDIKPSNLIITPRGEVKIIDFGLAKLAGQSRLTKSGSTPGTVAYMSPEQVSRPSGIDHRTDIWSLGVVLYEMLTGRPPFQGENEAAVIYAIVNELPPDMTETGEDVSTGVQRIVGKALDKMRDTRYQRVDDILNDLRHETTGRPELIEPPARKTRLGKTVRKLSYATAAFALIALIVFTIVIFNRKPASQVQPKHRQVTFTGDATWPEISPNGQFIAYLIQKKVGMSLMVQDLTGSRPLEVFTGNITEPAFLRWSPDATELLFSVRIGRTDEIYVIPRLGGEARRLPVKTRVCWSADGSQIISSYIQEKMIWFTDKVTGAERSIPVGGDFIGITDIDASPLNDRLLFLTANQRLRAIWTIKTDGSQQQKIIEENTGLASPRWSSDGKAIYYLREDRQTEDLMKIRISSSNGKAEAPPEFVQDGLQTGRRFALSGDNKRLVYARGLRYSNLWAVHLDNGKNKEAVQTRKLTTGTTLKTWPQISPDDKTIAFIVGDRVQSNIFVMPMAGGEMQQITFSDFYKGSLAWSPDGKEIAFGATQEGKTGVWKVATMGGVPYAYQKSELSQNTYQLAWRPGSNIVYHRPGNRNFHFLDPVTEAEKPLDPTNAIGHIFSPCYSPDGKNLAAMVNTLGGQRLARFSLNDSSYVSVQMGFLFPLAWSVDGKNIYAFDRSKNPNELVVISSDGNHLKTLLTMPFGNLHEYMSMASDGKQIVCAVYELLSDIWLMENFDQEVE